MRWNLYQRAVRCGWWRLRWWYTSGLSAFMTIYSCSQSLSPTDFPTVPSSVFRKVIRYQPRLLTEDQTSVMLVDIQRLLLKCAPSSPAIAGNMLSALCNFVSDIAPSSGCVLSSVLTDAKVKTWVSLRKVRDGESRTLTEQAVCLRRLIRVQRGLPSVLGIRQDRRISPPPLKHTELTELRDRCFEAGAPALRGFTAAFGAGVIGRSMIGATFIDTGDGVALRLCDGTVKPVVPWFHNFDLVNHVVHEGDWLEVVSLASKMRLHLQPVNASQTFREHALSEPASLAALCGRYRLGEEAVDSSIDYLAPVDIRNDREAAEALRGVPIEEWPHII